MNANQESKLNMYRATQKHCNDNTAIVNTVAAFSTTFAAFNANVSAIISTVQQQDLVTKGITVDKAEGKKTLCQLAADIGAPVFAYASTTANNRLKQEVNFSYSDLLKSKDDELAPRCQNIHASATANLAALAPFGITAALLTSLQNAINSYQAKVPTPRNAVALKTTLRTNLKNLFKQTDKILKEQLDKTAVGFKAANPNFLSTYKTNRSILDPGKATTQLKGVVTNSADGSLIKGATVLVVEANMTTETNKKGEYILKPLLSGKYTIKVQLALFTTQVLSEIVVKQGQTTTLDIVLVPVP